MKIIVVWYSNCSPKTNYNASDKNFYPVVFIDLIFLNRKNPIIMRSIVLSLIAIVAISFLASCARGITTEQAANGKARCGKSYIR